MNVFDAKITASIVTYNNADKIINTIQTILDNTKGMNFKLYISDNNSKDDTVILIKKRFPQVEVSENRANKGFGWGHNQIINQLDQTQSDYHAIINPDVLFVENTLLHLYSFMESNPDVVMSMPKILNPDLTEQFSPKKFPSIKYLLGGFFECFGKPFSTWRAEYTRKNESNTSFYDIEFCAGSFMFIRTHILKAIGGFDERYFMYFEDADLTRKALNHGRVIFYPNTAIVHSWNRASTRSLKYLLIQIISMFNYFKKWG